MINFQQSFNARNSTPIEIAKKFVYTDSFDRLKNPRHSIIFGARGCGKTTLMKMLTLPALYNWEDDKAQYFRKNISFFAIYVPNDVTWELKNESLSKTNISKEDIDTLINLSFNINIFISLINTFNDIIKYVIKENSETKEIIFSKFLIENLKLSKNTYPNFNSIKHELYKINSEVNVWINKYKNDFDINRIREVFPFIDIEFHSTSLLILEKFSSEDFYKINKKWAYCFDELEFAPSIIKTKLYKLLRSTDQRLLYKISSSPLVSEDIRDVLNSQFGASSGNDFESIKVWESQNNPSFQIELINKILKDNGIYKSIEEYFGSNKRYLEKGNRNDEDYFNEIKELSKKDNSFKEFLKKKELNLLNKQSLNDNSTVLRKIKPVVYFRNYLISENKNNIVKTKPHKKFTELYSGFELLKEIADGNPRWLIGLINSIIQKCGKENAEINKQYDEIIKVCGRFQNFINSIPIRDNKKYSYNDLINSIGNDFYNSLIHTNFNEEPETTFKIDSNDSELKKIIEEGLFQGAFVFAEEINDCEADLTNKRIKLSYLFHPLFKLLIRKNREKKITRILNKEKVNIINTPKLFEDEN